MGKRGPKRGSRRGTRHRPELISPRVLAMLDAYKAGENVTAIAKRFGVTQQAVCAAAKHNGLPKRNAEKLPPGIVEQVISAIQAGKDREEVKALFDLSDNNIRWLTKSRRLGNVLFRKIDISSFGEPGRHTVQDLRGKCFGHLKVVELAKVTGQTNWWMCHCSCGKSVIRCGKALKENGTVYTSCGCRKGDAIRAGQKANGFGGRPVSPHVQEVLIAYQSGEKLIEVAKRFRVTPEAIGAMARYYGLPRRRQPKAAQAPAAP